MEKLIPVITLNESVREFLAMPDGIKKNLVYNKKYRGYVATQANLLIKQDGTVHYSYTTYTVTKGVKFFLKIKSKNGFTVDPKGKMKVWFGAKLHSITHLVEILGLLGREWVKPAYIQYITSSVFGKIVAGKITNPHDLFKSILKLYRVKGSPSLMIKAIETVGSTMSMNMNKGLFLQAAKTAKHFDHFLEFIMKKENDFNHLTDLMEQAVVLERKIDFTWSAKRMAEEHKLWIKELMDYESDSMSKEPLAWLQPWKKFETDNIRLLDNEYDLFTEGKMMSHCVYTNYWPSMKNGSYLVFHVDDGTEYGATLGLSLWTDSIHFNQLYSRFNANVTPETRERIMDWFQYVKETFQNNLVEFKTKHNSYEQLEPVAF